MGAHSFHIATEFDGPDQRAGLSGEHLESLTVNSDVRDPGRVVLVERRGGLGVDPLWSH